jgi:hypothetical protein
MPLQESQSAELDYLRKVADELEAYLKVKGSA